MTCNISDYLVSRDERPLCTRLGNDYKEGQTVVAVISAVVPTY